MLILKKIGILELDKSFFSAILVFGDKVIYDLSLINMMLYGRKKFRQKPNRRNKEN